MDGITERNRQLTRLEQVRRAEAVAKRSAMDAGAFASGSDVKRLKLDPGAAPSVSAATNAARAALVGFDWRSMERDAVADLIVANLQHFSEEAIQNAIAVSFESLHVLIRLITPIIPCLITSWQTYRASKSVTDPAGPVAGPSTSEPLAPNLDDEEMEYEPDKLNMQLEARPI